MWTEQFEILYVKALLEKTSGNVTRAAELAGVNRRSLQRLIAESSGLAQAIEPHAVPRLTEFRLLRKTGSLFSSWETCTCRVRQLRQARRVPHCIKRVSGCFELASAFELCHKLSMLEGGFPSALRRRTDSSARASQ